MHSTSKKGFGTGLELLATGWPICQVPDNGCISQAQSAGHVPQAQRDVPCGEFQNQNPRCVRTRDLPHG